MSTLVPHTHTHLVRHALHDEALSPVGLLDKRYRLRFRESDWPRADDRVAKLNARGRRV